MTLVSKEERDMGSETQNDYHVVTKKAPTFYFVGVTTSKSSIMKVFPLWMKVLGREEVVIEGIDCAIHDQPEVYRQAVAQMKYDPLSLGALVTTHKIDLLTAARDMFDYLDPYALITDEVSSISKLEGRLEGHAKDPITSGPEPGRHHRAGLFWAHGRRCAQLRGRRIGDRHLAAPDQQEG